MDELIRKQDALDAFNGEITVVAARNAGRVYTYLKMVTDRIKALPPVQPKRGHWILDRSGAYCCSECMEPCATYVMMRPRDRFCKMCGADMRGNENGRND